LEVGISLLPDWVSRFLPSRHVAALENVEDGMSFAKVELLQL
jgi:hypothetical protein